MGQLWEKHKEIIITESLNIFIVIFGLVFLYIGLIPGSQVILLFPKNPSIPQIVGVITGVGITSIFFGIGNIYTYYKDYENGRDTKNIQNLLVEIKKTVESLQGSFFPCKRNFSDEVTEIPKKDKIKKIKLELEFEMAYLKAIGVSLTFITVIIGFLGISYGKEILDISVYGFPNISIGLILLGLLAICFILLLSKLLSEYHSKMAEISRIYNS
ncbi:hypothetical protein [Methanoregula sp.]|uniref:hypothetical protein n=1 Tax=Methanoregula sp. TaxID=2052170 RepID=UPI00236E58F2|nr:hypothetical protein [Methanoregula sp.]MDD1687905.1 hypothetical protein [Methanoregula sp.]